MSATACALAATLAVSIIPVEEWLPAPPPAPSGESGERLAIHVVWIQATGPRAPALGGLEAGGAAQDVERAARQAERQPRRAGVSLRCRAQGVA